MSTSIMIKAPSAYEDQHLGKINEAKKPFTWNMTNVPLCCYTHSLSKNGFLLYVADCSVA